MKDEAYYLRINDREVIYLLPPALIMAIFAISLIVLTETGILNLY
jgi:hypothetical protein